MTTTSSGGGQYGGAPGRRDAGRGDRPRRRFVPRRKVCAFCVEKVSDIDYKDVQRLRRYVSDRAKIDPRRRSGTCARHQRALSKAIKRARTVALLPFSVNHRRAAGV
ncbi:MAG: 30S ribosomal protein S18 [SAR202 cluster bacterium]|nr:30S ribosomal protein S18 [SAR202 cluster bacterium]